MSPSIHRVGDRVIVKRDYLESKQGKRNSFSSLVIKYATLSSEGDYIVPHLKMMEILKVKNPSPPQAKRAKTETIEARTKICTGCEFWDTSKLGKCIKCLTCNGSGLLYRAYSKCPLTISKWGPEPLT